jgi:hypothetical protein
MKRARGDEESPSAEDLREYALLVILAEKNEDRGEKTRGSKYIRRIFPSKFDKDGFLKSEFHPKSTKDRFREAFREGWKILEDEKKAAIEKEEEDEIARENAIEEKVVIFLSDIDAIQRIRNGAREGLAKVTIELPQKYLPDIVVFESTTSGGQYGHWHRAEREPKGKFLTNSDFTMNCGYDFEHSIWWYLQQRGIHASIDIKYHENTLKQTPYVSGRRNEITGEGYEEWTASPSTGYITLEFAQNYLD